MGKGCTAMGLGHVNARTCANPDRSPSPPFLSSLCTCSISHPDANPPPCKKVGCIGGPHAQTHQHHPPAPIARAEPSNLQREGKEGRRLEARMVGAMVDRQGTTEPERTLPRSL